MSYRSSLGADESSFRPTGNRDNYPHHFAIDLRD